MTGYGEANIKALLLRHGFKFSKSMGQNFLIDAAVPEKIAEMADIDGAGVLEIGPGIGALTAQLCKRAKKVVSVELDTTLKPLLAETLYNYDNSEIVYGDILKTDIEALVKEKFPDMRVCACANLPYNITTPVLTKLIDSGLFESITVMVQREVARRIASKPGTPDYGAFTVYAQFYTEPEILFDVPPDCFMPAPKVHSSVITLKKREEIPPEVKDADMFFRVVKASFAQRRKTLINGLSSAFGGVTKEELSKVIENCGFDLKVRGETLGIPEFAALSEKLQDFMNGKKL